MAELLPCTCGSDDIAVFEERYFFFPTNAFIKCQKCGRTVEKRTLKSAVKLWNTRTPKERGADE